MQVNLCVSVFFFKDPATTELYTLSLHDALPISERAVVVRVGAVQEQQPDGDASLPLGRSGGRGEGADVVRRPRSEEHTSELQSQSNLVCRLLLEKKKQTSKTTSSNL